MRWGGLRDAPSAHPKVTTVGPFHTRRRTSGAWVATQCSHPSCLTRARRTSESLMASLGDPHAVEQKRVERVFMRTR